LGCNPNVGGVVLVGWEEGQLESIASRITETGKPVETVSLIETGTIDATAEATAKTQEIRKRVSETPRTPIELADLTIATECGGSDTSSGLASNPAVGEMVDQVIDGGGTAMFSETVEIMGGEDLLADRAQSDQTAQEIHELVDKIQTWSDRVGYNINDKNPVPDNKKGGLTTIEEKSLGAIKKGGTKPIKGVLDYGKTPSSSGLYFMDTPAPAQESITGLVAGGAQIVVFSTGSGNPAGNPLAPVLKVTGNEKTIDRMSEHIDVDVSGVISGELTLEEAGDKVLEEVVKVADGKSVAAEILGHNEFAIKRAGDWIVP
jgi:altronate dehydratase large subunit